MARAEAGTFYGVGVGPGDPELITLKTARVLAAVDWIYHPAGAKGKDGFARRIVAGLGLPDDKFRGVSLCMTRDRATDLSTYAAAAAAIGEEVQTGRSVAWITEGDPLLYSTFIHVYDELRARYPLLRTEIVPGISSVQAAAARAEIPLANLDESIAILPATYGLNDLCQLLDDHATVALLKVHSVIDQLRNVLQQRPELRAFYIENAGTAAEWSTEALADLDGRSLPYFSLVLLRRTAANRPASLEQRA